MDFSFFPLFAMIRNLWECLQILIVFRLHTFFRVGSYWSYVDFFESRVDKNGSIVQVISVEEETSYTLRDMEQRANRISHWGLAHILKQKECVALMMLNRVDFVCIWLGLAKIGVSTAFLNTNLSGKPLLHSVHIAVDSSETKILILDDELASHVTSSELAELKDTGICVYYWNDIAAELAQHSDLRPNRLHRHTIKESDPLLYIYTSGTTGLPKASKITSTRYFAGGIPTSIMAYMQPGHRLYCCLPLYHTSAGMMCVSAAIRSGATLVLRKKFSVRSFSSDCVQYNISSMQYIGELCRYLVNAPPNPNDAKLKLHYAMGNGLRPDVWTKFRERYGVERIIEFYGATEGNVGMFNTTNQVGAIGFLPPFLDFIYPIKIVKVQPDDPTSPLRDTNGFCIPAKLGEPGLLIGVINNKVVDRRFDGYSDASATKNKILTNVFRDGDQHFNSGDLLSRDAWGYFYWCDRVGDTFRWKGENVATTEVAHVLADVPDIDDVTVYGVAVPNCDGRVGMASIVLRENRVVDNFDWSALHKQMSANLPVYARPAFFRFRPQMALTGTFKHQKGDLVKDGFDPSTMKGDRLFYYSAKDGKHEQVTPELYANICAGKIIL